VSVSAADAQPDGCLIEGIVHTAPLNPGNWCRPDSASRVVGINTAIISSAQGIGFAGRRPRHTGCSPSCRTVARRRLLGRGT
jgi:hypothetical protein